MPLPCLALSICLLSGRFLGSSSRRFLSALAHFPYGCYFRLVLLDVVAQ
ncbi:hypothetical protein FM103_19420 [Corynebacterium xerosis]|nr:hypothetical protein FM103_19420 [Corynebacterium xerosis]